MVIALKADFQLAGFRQFGPVALISSADVHAFSDGVAGGDPAVRFSKDNAAPSLFAWLVERSAGELETVNEAVTIPDVNRSGSSEALLREM